MSVVRYKKFTTVVVLARNLNLSQIMVRIEFDYKFLNVQQKWVI